MSSLKSTCITILALGVHALHLSKPLQTLSPLSMLLLSLMLLSTHVNISEAARSCIKWEMELRSDALSETRTRMKIIVISVLESHTSPTTIFLISATLSEIRGFENGEDQRVVAVRGWWVRRHCLNAIVDSPEIFWSPIRTPSESFKSVSEQHSPGHLTENSGDNVTFWRKKAKHKGQHRIRIWLSTPARKKKQKNNRG